MSAPCQIASRYTNPLRGEGFTIGGARNRLQGDEAREDVSQTQQLVRQLRTELEEVLITATLRDTPVDQLPASVTVLDAQQFEGGGIQHFGDVLGQIPNLNWAGFYLLRADELVVGPFQGRPACVRIALGRGVCGTAAAQRRSIIVPDVDEFAGHIACDSASKSEIVVPMIVGERLLGVLDVDSPNLGRFSAEDQVGLEAFVNVLLSEWRGADRGR